MPPYPVTEQQPVRVRGAAPLNRLHPGPGGQRHARVHTHHALAALAWVLAVLYAVDRLLKLLAVHRLLRRPLPPAPQSWPSVTLLQPITRGASDLPTALARRAALRYRGHLQQILICDVADTASITLCRSWLATHPNLAADLMLTPAAFASSITANPSPIATKVEKLLAALPHATGDILVFVDDDILLRPNAIDHLVRHLQNPRAGAVFGLAAYTNWSNIPSSLLSAFVNANALLSYLPLTWLAEPYTITGHFYALRREVFAAVGGLDGMEGRFDDDHELARRIQRHGLANVQTSVVYDVDNYLWTIDGYTNQMRRWFIIPRQTMAPYLTPYQQFVSLLGSLGNLIPPLLALLTLVSRTTLAPLLTTMTLFAAVYTWCEHAYLDRTTPPIRWPLVLISAIVAPLQALGALLGGDTFLWRGQHIRLHRGGRFDILATPGSTHLQEVPASRRSPPPGSPTQGAGRS